VKRGGKQKQCGYKQAENRAHFAHKLVLFSPSKNCYFWWVDKSVSYILNAFKLL